MKRTIRKKQLKRRAAVTVELALVLPVFIVIILGIIEFGRMFMVQQVITNASREGARMAVIEGSTESDVRSEVNKYLTNASLNGCKISVKPADLPTLGFGDDVTVQVAVPFESVSWSAGAWFLGGMTLEASSVMQAERLQ